MAAVQSDPNQVSKMYELGEHSYFSESAYNMDNWAFRYWGSNAPILEVVK